MCQLRKITAIKKKEIGLSNNLQFILIEVTLGLASTKSAFHVRSLSDDPISLQFLTLIRQFNEMKILLTSTCVHVKSEQESNAIAIFLRGLIDDIRTWCAQAPTPPQTPLSNAPKNKLLQELANSSMLNVARLR